MSAPSPLWYTTRGLGLVLLLTVTATVVLGTMTTSRWRNEGWPRFLTSELHRNLSLLALALLPLHGLTVVLDSYARLGLKDITVPFASAYRPLWLGLGVLAGELVIVLVLTSLVRQRIGHRLWRAVHWAAYATWPLAVLHGLGTGSDTRAGWALLVYVGCAGAVVLAVLTRLALHRPEVTPGRVATGFGVMLGVLAIVIWTMLGPLQPGWAAAAGTPPDLLGGRTAAAATPAPGPGASLRAGLDDALTVSVDRAGGGSQVVLTDDRDPSLEITLTIAGADATSGPLEVRSQGAVVCRTEATLGDVVTAICGTTRLEISLSRAGRGLHGELVTRAG